jgi:hypothetical protein
VWLIVGTLKTSNLGLFGLGEKPVAGHLAGFFGIQKNASQVHSFAMSTASRKMSGGFLDLILVFDFPPCGRTLLLNWPWLRPSLAVWIWIDVPSRAAGRIMMLQWQGV